MKIDVWEWNQWQHPRATQFLDRLISIDFAERYDALCRAHPVRGKELPVAQRHAAIAAAGRPMYWSKLWGCYFWRETWRIPSGLPKFAAVGLDIRIDARVELDLLFATPDGHLSGPFPRFLKQIRKRKDPKYTHHNPAPRIGSPDELPVILAECLALYDDVVDALRADTWWECAPKPWLEPDHGREHEAKAA